MILKKMRNFKDSLESVLKKTYSAIAPIYSSFKKTLNESFDNFDSTITTAYSNFGESAKHKLLNGTISLVSLVGITSPALANGTEFYSNTQSSQENSYQVFSKDSIPEKTYQTTSKDYSKDFETENAHIHFREDGDTIVSFKNKEQEKEFYEQMEKAFPNNSKDPPEDPQDPRWGLNEYVSAYDSLYQTNLDWYGSGDVNNDGVIDMLDYNSTITGNDPFNDGTYRGDTDLDGVSGTANDKQIIYEYLTGQRNHINRWEFETIAEMQNHYNAYLNLTPTKNINPLTSGWLCYNFGIQDFTYCNGVYDIENSPYAEDNGTNLQYDISKNGIFRIPLRLVSVWTTSGVPHAINNVYLGSPNNQDALEFNYRIYSEPQTGEIVEPGDFSFNANEYAHEIWRGYFYSNFSQEWMYGSRSLVNYDLDEGNATLTYSHPNLVLQWTPFDKVVYPQDQEHEYFVGINENIDPGYPDSLYVGTQVNHSMDSTQTNNQTCSDVTFNQEHTWDLIAGAYNSSNSPQGSHVQDIFVHDWSVPEFEVDENGPFNIFDNSGLPITFEKDSTSTQGTNPNQCNYYTYDITESYTGTDVCENSDTKDYVTQIQDLQGPFVVEYPVANGDTIFAPEGANIHPDSLNAWAVWEDPEASPIIKEYEDELIEETEIHKLWLRDQFGFDVCSNPSLDLVWHYIHEPKPTGINNKKSLESILGNAFPNPTKGKFKLEYNLSKNQRISAEIYNNLGQLVDYFSEEQFTGENILELDISDKAKGMYFLEVSVDGKPVGKKKVVKQ